MTSRRYTFIIERHDPEAGRRWTQRYDIGMAPSERVLDGLVRIKDTLDSTLTFRRSCAHGVCGSCAMNINGVNALACGTLMAAMPSEVRISPLPALPVIRDLVVDMRAFFDHNEAVIPYLVNEEPPPERERLQSPAEQRKIVASISCIMCGSCTNACPSFWFNNRYLGPAALLKAYRFVFDSRDRRGKERLDLIAGPHGLWRCHCIFNCVEACPKEIDITAHISELKRLAAGLG